MKSIAYTKPSITDLEISYATDAATNGWGKHCYDYIHRFEQGFTSYLDVKYAISTSSCTGALHMGLFALGIGPGDEVILADINWVATAAPIVHLGATPVFVDILEDTWCIDPLEVEKAITSKTKAIIAVHLYGNLCNMDALLSISSRYGIPIIEDAAEAIGSEYKGKKAGSIGTFGTFSFHGTKTLTTGEGGMFVTNDEVLFDRVLTLSNHGRSKQQTKQFWPDMVGFKYKMSNIQAAIGCAQLERIDDLISAKRKTFATYSTLLSDLPLSLNPEAHDCINGFWMPTIVAHETINFDRDELITTFTENNIDARVFFWPLSMTNCPGIKPSSSSTISSTIYKRALNLPSPHEITSDQIQFICSLLRDYCAKT